MIRNFFSVQPTCACLQFDQPLNNNKRRCCCTYIIFLLQFFCRVVIINFIVSSLPRQKERQMDRAILKRLGACSKKSLQTPKLASFAKRDIIKFAQLLHHWASIHQMVERWICCKCFKPGSHQSKVAPAIPEGQVAANNWKFFYF